MRKHGKKLTLHRETLRSLEEGKLGKAAGGTMGSNHTFCNTDCPWCPTDQMTQSSCYDWTCGW